MQQGLFFIAGFAAGVLLALALLWWRQKDAASLAEELVARTEAEKIRNLEEILERLKEAFAALSMNALSQNAESFLRLAGETLNTQTQVGAKELESKKLLIDHSLENLNQEMARVRDLIRELEKDRELKYGELAKQLRSVTEETSRLHETAHQLKTALAGTKQRGRWGERMAEDVLRVAGFIEGINYRKQKAMPNSAGRPDFTFFLPQGLVVNMDVKFPIDNYLRYLEAEGEAEKEQYRAQFLRDVRGRIREVTTRDYINPDDRTVDFVIVFIPNEQIYAFIHENDNLLLDDAISHRVVLCSPLTLYAILSVIRHAVDNFKLEQAANEILALFGSFNKQWQAFNDCLEKMGRRLDEAQKEYQVLTTTRKQKLEQPLRRIEALRTEKGIELDPRESERGSRRHSSKQAGAGLERWCPGPE